MRAWVLVLLLLAAACDGDDDAPAAPPDERAEEPAEARAAQGDPAETAPEPAPLPPPPNIPVAPPSEGPVIAIDTHVDTTQRMLDEGDDPFEPLEGGHLDVPRMREGGLTGAFFSIYVSPRRVEAGEPSWERALALIARVREVAEAHPDEAVLATSAEDVRRAAREGKIAMLMGVEGAHALGTDDPERALERIRELHRRGARYMTITWSVDNPLGHSSTGEHPDRGLTPLGRRAVRLMNELGMIVDVSHVSDRTFWDIMEVAERPVLASHSSARALADHPRNMRDRMIHAVAAGGGAVCVNYYTQYIDADYRGRRRAIEVRRRREFEALDEDHESWVDRGRAAFALARRLDPELDPPDLGTLADHFEHIVRIGGPSAACLGSDFDGVPELPVGMEDVSDLGALRAALEARDLPIRPIFGGNVLRVLAAAGPGDADADRGAPEE